MTEDYRPRAVLDADIVYSRVRLSSDPADIHVCALALAAEVNYLFTTTGSYLRDALSDHGVHV